MKKEYRELKPYLLFWGTQSLSTLGSGMTSYALVLWSYLPAGSVLVRLFGAGKGSGAAFLFLLIGVIGVAVCLIFSLILKKYSWSGPNSG